MSIKLAGRILTAFIISCVMGSVTPSPARTSKVDILIEKLVEKGILSRPEAEAIRTEVETAEKESHQRLVKESNPWLKDLTSAGDIRLRAETFDFKHSQQKDRERFRVRLRWGLEKKFNDMWRAGFRVSSGPTDQAVSTNQSLDDEFDLKNLSINRVYGIFTPTPVVQEWAPAVRHVEIGGGKVANPYAKWGTSLVWDSDVEPEGVYERVDIRLADVGEEGYWDLNALFGQWILEEQSTREDVRMMSYGVGTEYKNDQKQWADLKYVFYDWQDYDSVLRGGIAGSGEEAFFDASNLTGTTPAGNEIQVDAFKIHSFYVAGGMPVDTIYFGEQPLKIFWQYVFNTQVGDAVPHPDDDDAWTAGVTIGRAGKKGTSEITYQYYWVEANATVGNFMESDLGTGGTNHHGNKLQFKYMLTDAIGFAWTNWFVDDINDGTSASDPTVWKSQADLIFKF